MKQQLNRNHGCLHTCVTGKSVLEILFRQFSHILVTFCVVSSCNKTEACIPCFKTEMIGTHNYD